jgi:hypothetical protein
VESLAGTPLDGRFRWRGALEESKASREGGEEAITDPTWQDMVGLLASGAIGSLLVWGYQKWL